MQTYFMKNGLTATIAAIAARAGNGDDRFGYFP